MSEQRDARAKRCQSKGMSKQRGVNVEGCQSKEMSKPRDVRAKECQSNGLSEQRDVKAKASFSHLPLSDLEGGLARKPRFHIFHFQILRGVSRESLVFTSSPFRF